MGLLSFLFGKGGQQDDDARDYRAHAKTLRDLGMDEKYIPREVAERRQRIAENREATKNWPRDENGNFC